MGLRLRCVGNPAYGSLRRARFAAVPTEVALADDRDRPTANLRDCPERHPRQSCMGTKPAHRVELDSSRRAMGDRVVFLGERLLADSRDTREDPWRCVPAPPVAGTRRHSLISKVRISEDRSGGIPEHWDSRCLSTTPGALPARGLADRRRPDAMASRPTPALDSRPPFDAFLFHAREYHNTSRAVRQTSRKPREDCESDTTPVSPFGGKATRTSGAVRVLSDDVLRFRGETSPDLATRVP